LEKRTLPEPTNFISTVPLLPSFPRLQLAQPLLFTKRKKTRIVPCLINLLLRKSTRSHPGICKPQIYNPLGFAKTGKRKLGTKSCSLATAALRHFRFVPSLLHTLKKGSSITNSNPHPITPATSSQQNQHQGYFQDTDLVNHQPDGQTSPAVPDDVLASQPRF
jgi:hypothetical protein